MSRAVIKKLFFILLVSLVGVFSKAMAAPVCSKSQTGAYIRVAERLEVQRVLNLIFDQESAGKSYDLQQGGFIELNPKVFTPEVGEGVSEILRHYVRSNATKIKIDKKTRKVESMVLGVPIGYGYTVEIYYIAKEGKRAFGSILDGEGIEEKSFRGLYFDRAEVVEPPPSTLRIPLSLTLSRRDGNLGTSRLRKSGPLAGIPKVEEFNYKIDVPESIEGPVLDKLEDIADRLQYMPKKEDLVGFIQDGSPESIAELEKFLFIAQQKHMSGDYMLRGIHKQIPKIVYGWVTDKIGKIIAVGSLAATLAIFPEQSYDAAKWVYSKVTVSSAEVAKSMLNGWSQKEDLPNAVRADLKKLELMVEGQARGGRFNSNLQNFPADINKSGKFNFEASKYLWFETRIDRANNKAIEIMYIAKLGSDNQWLMYAMPVDPKEIPNLYDYTKNRLRVQSASE